MVEQSDELRIYLFQRNDIAIPPGKLAGQGGHAALSAAWRMHTKYPERVIEYMSSLRSDVLEEGQTKVTLGASLSQLERLHREFTELGLPHVKVIDQGRTVFAEPTVTFVAIGPIRRSELPKFAARLRLL